MKLFVTGREGQVAQALAQYAGDDVTVMCIGRPELDLGEPETIRRAIATHKPDVVVNPAAYTAVDKAESERDLAFAINRDGAGHVAAAAADLGLPVIHFSTDYVFAGDKTAPYTETDPTDPQGVYGASKLAGEKAVEAANPAHVILRTAWVYAPWGHNFARTMLRLAMDRDLVRVVADQQGTPTYAPDIAEAVIAVARVVTKAPASQDWRGVFHMTGGGETTWAGFAEAVFDHSKTQGGASADVEPITTADYPTPARRPANSRLDNTRFERVFGHALPHWQNGVARFAARMAR
ncbi:dTDP-4-dehydrorhamnose reductase [Aureimonas mangrovi]|uniref:dTDP-4-dehydrorhamnose reductase n=1 Tax=Aureimonas mangrovi TaxID=2758041 RepID=UPI00163D9942|nr:dTDP-4-dehydrorhamnose reductase [Aureimonas mangrovi]